MAQEETADHVLLQQACAGDQAAFEVLVLRYQTMLYHFVTTYVDSEQAQDVVQFVLLQLYLSMSRLRENAMKSPSLKAWLLRVARNRCLDEQRKHKRQALRISVLEEDKEEENSPIFASLLDPDPLPEEQVEQQEKREQLYAAILALPPRLSVVVWLHCKEDLSFPAIGNRLNIPPSTAKTYFYRACQKMRATFSS
jgi:RNA polymerase sigma-70 factor (ECF subfamily)